MIKRTFKELNYIVYDHHDQLVIQTDNYDEAIKEYEKCKEIWKQYVLDGGAFGEEAKVVLAVVLKDFHASTVDDGSKDWDFHEDTYDVSVRHKKTLQELANRIFNAPHNKYLIK